MNIRLDMEGCENVSFFGVLNTSQEPENDGDPHRDHAFDNSSHVFGILSGAALSLAKYGLWI